MGYTSIQPYPRIAMHSTAPTARYCTKTKKESANLAVLTGLSLAHSYYFSEAYDATHAFPNSNHVADYDREFVWNHHLRDEFTAAGIGGWCVALLQGTAMSLRTTECDLMHEATVGIVTRRSCLNPVCKAQDPGGLNSLHCPANEYEVELLLYTQRDRPCTNPNMTMRWSVEIRWASQILRAGSVPIVPQKLGSTLTGKDSCCAYWSRILSRYGGGSDVVCLSLLTQGEISQQQALVDSLAVVKKKVNVRADCFNYDWKAGLASGFDVTAEDLWRLAVPALVKHGLNAGVLEYSKQGGAMMNSSVSNRQQGIFRVSCCDGAEKSCTASFVIALQAVPELCRLVGVGPSKSAVSATPHSWPFSDLTLEQVRAQIPRSLLSNLVVLYTNHSDTVSALFLGPATPLRSSLHHHPAASPGLPVVFGELMPAFQSKLAATVLKDPAWAQQMELLVLHDRNKHFPSIGPRPDEAPRGFVGKEAALSHVLYETQLLSCFPYARLVNQVPCAVDLGVLQDLALISSIADNFEPWVVPAGVRHASLSIVLPSACVVTELHLTVRNTGVATELLTPAACDVLVGHHSDACFAALTGLRLPFAPDGTVLRYCMPKHVSGLAQYADDGEMHPFCNLPHPAFVRVVHVTFHSLCPTAPMLLPTVQVFGRTAHRPALAHPPQPAYGEALGYLRGIRETVVLPSVVPPPPLQAEPGGQAGVRSPLLLPVHPSTAGRISACIDALQAAFDGEESRAGSDDDDSEGLSDQELGFDQLPSAADGCSEAMSAEGSFDESLQDLTKRADAYRITLAEKSKRIIDLSAALELEHRRLQLRIPALLRDTIIYEQGHESAAFNPWRLVFYKDPVVEATVRRRLASAACSSCQRSLRFSLRRLSCAYCRMTFCKDCMARHKSVVLEYGWDSPNNDLCLGCAEEIQRQKSLIKKLQTFSANEEADDPPTLMYSMFFRNMLHQAPQLESKTYETLISRPYSVAELPFAAIVSTVPTHLDSPPIESILYHPDRCRMSKAPWGSAHGVPELSPLHEGTFWFSPDGAAPRATVDIFMPIAVHATSIVLVADCLGYTEEDQLLITVETGLHLGGLSPCGEWSVGTMAPSSKKEFSLVNGAAGDNGSQVLRLSLELNNKEAEPAAGMRRRLHLGTVLVLGLPRLPDPVSDSEETDSDVRDTQQQQQQEAMASGVAGGKMSYTAVGAAGVSDVLQPHAETIERVPLRKENEEWTRGKHEHWVATITLRAADLSKIVMGFAIAHKHDDPTAHTRNLRVALFRGSAVDMQSLIHAGDYVVPNVSRETPLHYLFPAQHQLSTIRMVRFEVFGNYGATTSSRPAITLFTSSIRVSVAKTFPHTDYCKDFVSRTAEYLTEAKHKAALLSAAALKT
ncbi:putative phosphoinositide phosphatase SAC9 [Diplonema papillatum]|nr:putative phosphoinositide phosphatase SAC9 [Diplonema papillatum]KAJ9445600.1 putative phosphoinositide phosphatase SAC9 [Diplonema papillatum]